MDRVERVGRGFDRLGGSYDALAWIFAAGAIRRSQGVLLSTVARDVPGPVLVAGGGTGGVVIDLLAGGYGGRVVCVDVSARMLERTRGRVERERPQDLHRVELRHDDLLRIRDRATYGLVAAHFVLDLFDDPQLGRAVAALDAALRPDGLWSYVDFALPSGSIVRRACQRAVLGSLYMFFRRTCGISGRTLPDVPARLSGIGWRPIARRAPAAGWLEASLWRRR